MLNPDFFLCLAKMLKAIFRGKLTVSKAILVETYYWFISGLVAF
jgi:hypothetical protein